MKRFTPNALVARPMPARMLASALVIAGAALFLAPSQAKASVSTPTLSRVNPSAAASAQYELSAVSCSSSTWCVTVGSRIAKTATTTLAEVWNGTGWAAQATANPTGSSKAYLTGVACTSVSACVAVGYYVVAAKQYTLAEDWNGTAWAVVPTPNVTGEANSLLAAVSCVSGTSCTAVGTAYGGKNPFVTLVEVWNGATWTIQASPNPSGSVTSRLFAVSCPSSTFCSAVGLYYTATTIDSLAENWNGTSWAVVPTPNRTVSFGELESVSCTSSTSCTAVGDSAGALIEGWNGTAWAIDKAPTPSENLFGDSCSSSAACIAVGSGMSTEFWNGTAWTTRKAHQPASGAVSRLAGVSCASATFCMAAGTQAAHTLAEIWTGTGWRMTSTKW